MFMDIPPSLQRGRSPLFKDQRGQPPTVVSSAYGKYTPYSELCQQKSALLFLQSYEAGRGAKKLTVDSGRGIWYTLNIKRRCR